MTDDDTLAAALAGAADMAGTAPARRCLAGRILDDVAPDNRATILTYLYSDTVTDTALAQMLTRGGRPVSASLLSNHRRGACICTVRADDEPIGNLR